MSLNLVLDYESSALAAPASFRNAMQTAANILDSLIQNNITVTIQVGYGDWDNGLDTGLTTGAEGGDLSGVEVSYTSLRSALASHETSTVDQTFVNSLPNTSSVNGVSNLWVPSAVGKALGLVSPTNPAIDGAVGIGTEIPTNLLVGVALHELTHAMGREPDAGTFDLFRYTSPGVHLFTTSSTAVPAYFSIDGGYTKLADFGQTSDPSDFLNSGVQGSTDAFNEFYSSNTLQSLTPVDITLLNALGFDTTPAVVTVIETDGSNSLTLVGSNYFLDGSGGTGPTLKDGGAAVVAGQFGAWTPIAMEPVGGGYEVVWKLAGADQYTVWTTDSSGNYLSNIAPVSGTSYTIEALETTFHHDLNGDGMIGPVTTVIETDGSNSLTQVTNEYFLDSSGSGSALKDAGAAVVAGQFGAWTPIAMEPVGGGYEVVWKLMGSDQYTVWTIDSSGNYLSNTPPVSGTSYTIESLETTFHHDLNGDGMIGPTTTVIEADGSNSLTQVTNEYFLDSNGSGPALKDAGAAVVAGQFGAWTPIAEEPVAGGYEVVWKLMGSDQYTVWTTDSSGNYLSDIPQVSGTSYAIESLETTFHHDLNGDGIIGPTTTVIEADGSNSLTQVANEYFLYSSGSGPSLKYNGAAVTAGEFGTWTPIAMEPVAGGYEVVWKVAGADQYTVWTTDSSGNFLSDIPQVSGSSYAIGSLETTFHHDLNGDGHIGLVVGTGATLEVPGAASGSVLFAGWTGTLQLDTPAAFTGSISDFTGNGTFSGSDHIDLTTLAFNNLVQADSTYNTSTDVLQVSNGTTVDDLQFLGIYTQANFKFASDGHGGTIVYDPPAIDITDNRTITGGADLNGSQITVESGAALTLNNVNAPGATITNNGTVSVTNNSTVNLAAGPGQDNFVFAPNFGQATISHFTPGTDTLQIDHTLFAGMNALLASLHDDGHGDAVITDTAHDTITLQNVTTAQLLAHQDAFHLV